MDRRDALRLGGTALAAGLAGCSGGGGGGTETDGGTDSPIATTDEPTPTRTTGDLDASWRTREVTDVLTGEKFAIADFEGQPVMLEFFAVWCPVCTRQQSTMADLLSRRENVVVISINTDPNETAEEVRKHAESNGFDWRYTVAPEEWTAAFVERFSSVITSPPSAPVVRICPNGRAKLVDGLGHKDVDRLEAALDDC
ncbi:MAG: peroxiredoxin family protein [Halobaculum sp.]